MRRLTLLVALSVGLAGCVEIPPGTGFGPPLNKRPMDWSEEDDTRYGAMLRENPRAGFAAFCANYRQGSAGGERLRQEDYQDYEQVFNAWGMTARDIELIRAREQMFGTDQTFLGLTCSLGYTPRVNKSFYQGIGHRWQAVLGDSSRFIYLEGNGTEAGMRVTAWN